MVFAAAGGSPKVLRMDDGPELVSQALQRFCEARSISAIGMEYVCESLVSRVVETFTFDFAE